MTGGKAVIAREHIAPGELIGVWSGRVVSTEELDALAPEIRMHTVQVEEELYLASIGDTEPPDYINHSCDPNAGLDGQIGHCRHARHRARRGGDHRLCDVRRLALRRVRLLHAARRFAAAA